MPGEGPYECDTTHYQYDAQGKVIRERTRGRQTRHTYDRFGNPTHTHDGGRLSWTWSYRYDAQGRWTHRHEEDRRGSRVEKEDITRDYGAAGLVRETIIHDHPYGIVTHTVRTFDRFGNPVRESETAEGEPRGELRWRYRHDAAGNWVRRQRWDLLCRACGVEDTRRQYDRHGNLIREWSPDSGRSGAGYRYDAQGRLLRSWLLDEPAVQSTYEYVGTQSASHSTDRP